MKRILSDCLIGLCFAVPASTFSWAVTRTAPNFFWFSVPFSAAVGTGLLSIFIWKFVALKCDDIAIDMLCGASVGVFSHPLVAALSVFVAMLLSAAGFIPNEGVGGPLPNQSILTFLKAIGFIVFWWCISAMCGVGWVTMLIGGVVGLILGICRYYFLNDAAGAESFEVRESPHSLQSEFVNFRIRKTLISNSVALFVVACITGGVVALVGSAAPERVPEFVIEIEKDA